MSASGLVGDRAVQMLEQPASSPKRTGRRREPKSWAPSTVPVLLTVAQAASVLSMTPNALRARLRRTQVAGADGAVTAPLGPGIVGLKVGSTWRVRFDSR
jgi:hypothetical protein